MKDKVIIDARMVEEYTHGIGRYTYELVTRNSNKINYILLTNNIEKTKKIFNSCKDKLEFIEVKSKFLSVGEQIELPIIINKYKGKAIFHTPSFVSSPFINIDTIMTIHDLNHVKFPEFYSFFHKYYYKFIVKICAKKSKKIITVSEFSKNEIIDWLKCDVNKVLVTYNGIDISFFNHNNEINEIIVTKYNLPEKYILYVGNTKPHKNICRLIKAFSMIKEEKYKLILNGKPTYEIEKLIDSLGLNDKVKFIGFVSEEDLPAIYNQADLFVFPSLYEGFGLPPLEALACGTNVVTSNNTALGELFNRIAITVNPYSEEDIAWGINQGLNNLSTNDINIINELKSKFDWDKLCSLTLKEYVKIFN